MNVAFLTETNYRGKWPENFPNIRTEIAWQITLDSTHYYIDDYKEVKGYDAVFIIFPKGDVNLNMIGVELIHRENSASKLFSSNIIDILKTNNKGVYFVQEGPSWFFNEYDMTTQFHFYNQLAECDILFAHNKLDISFYKGLFPGKKVNVIPSLMVAPLPPEIQPKEKKAIIGGNFCRWYGGFQSYMVASHFDCPIYVPSSHCKRPGEEQVPNLIHLPWVNWTQWMQQLSNFKYAVNLMPTVAAGTFSMNCAYWGIPCIGNINVNTQYRLHPDTSVDVSDIEKAVEIAEQLKDDIFYKQVSMRAREELIHSWHFDRERWLAHIESVING